MPDVEIEEVVAEVGRTGAPVGAPRPEKAAAGAERPLVERVREEVAREQERERRLRAD